MATSGVLTATQRARALRRWPDGRVSVAASEHRSQHRNRVAARERLAEMLREAKNVIIQNLGFSKIYQDGGDGIAVQKSTNVWIDHCDLSSDLDHGKDYYDGLADFSHAADYITVR